MVYVDQLVKISWPAQDFGVKILAFPLKTDFESVIIRYVLILRVFIMSVKSLVVTCVFSTLNYWFNTQRYV